MKYIPAGTKIEGPDGMGYEITSDDVIKGGFLHSKFIKAYGGAPEVVPGSPIRAKWLLEGLKEKAIERD